MITKITTIEELKQAFVEILLDKTDKITKVSDGSVDNGVAFGAAKLAQKQLKDIALIESYLFPDSAFGQHLDNIGRLNGVGDRFGASGSTTYVRVVGNPGTFYKAGYNIFTSTNGTIFDMVSDFTIGQYGFGYIKVNSQTAGTDTLVDALTITKVSPSPTGHNYVINEYQAVGGKDNEDDDIYRKRIKESANILARGTINMLEQAFLKINSKVLRVVYQGIDGNGQIVLAILTENGQDLTPQELTDILVKGQQIFSLTELRPDGFTGYGITLKNISWQPIDISARVEIYPSYNPDDVRKEAQIRINKYFDYRFWKVNQKIYWTDLLDILHDTPGVKLALDNYFFPNVDVSIDQNKLPRVRGFLLLDKFGAVISNGGNTLNPIYYPPTADFIYQQQVLASI